VTFALTSPGGWGSNAIKQAGGLVAPRREPARFSEATAWRYLAVSTRRARQLRSGHACRVPRRRAFGRGFDSRRLHHSLPKSLENWPIGSAGSRRLPLGGQFLNGLRRGTLHRQSWAERVAQDVDLASRPVRQADASASDVPL